MCLKIILSEKLPMGKCPMDLIYYERSTSQSEWFGAAYVNFDSPLRDWSNITISVLLECADFENKTYLGKVDVIDPKQSSHYGKSEINSIFLEIRFPITKQMPNIIEFYVDGKLLCSNSVQQEDTVLILLKYEFDLLRKSSKNLSEIFDRKKIEAIAFIKLFQAFAGIFGIGNPGGDKNPGADINATCGLIEPIQSSIPLVLNGEAYPRGAWPWLVSVFAYDGSKLGFRCGGTLISNILVVTAAHCFFNQFFRKLPIDDITIVLGQHNIRRYDSDTKIIYPKSVNIHPNYRTLGSADSDIAVVVFPEKVAFTKYIKPVCLWKEPKGLESVVGQRGVVAGWGRDENGNAFTALPKKLEIPVVSDATCLRSHQAFQMITTEQTFCGGWRNGSYSPCNGDSGGGMIFNREGKWFIRGIVSTSLSNQNICDPNEYVVFVDVVPFLEWIKSFSDDPDLL
ncbi:hypothetical protein DMENIID0001_062170 [Sergentomyia squamirostris]